jgi:hypothetical protein
MKSGSRIDGYWVWWPFHGSEHARRFKALEDAQAYLPIKKDNKGRQLPLGIRRIIRVAWDPKKIDWSYDLVEELEQHEVDELFYKQAQEVAAS